MLSAVSTLLETIKTIAYFSIYLSYNTGKLIVCGLVFCFQSFGNLLSTLWSLLVIVNEDLYVFLTDLTNRLCCLIGAIQHLLQYIGDLFVSLVCGIKTVIFGTLDAFAIIFHGIVDVIMKIFTGLTAAINGLKYLIVLFGSGVWFVVTLIPVFIVYTYFLMTYYAGRAMDELKTLCVTFFMQIANFLTDAVNFFIDVPLEAAAGLLICASLIYAIVRFHWTVYNSLNELVWIVLSTIHDKMIRLQSVIRPAPPVVDSDDSSLDSDDSGNTEDILGPPDGIELTNNDPGWMTKRERYRQILQEESNQNCIICTEKSKCILLMPCRHLSTCKECTETLQRYQQNCPICRRYISYTIHVY